MNAAHRSGACLDPDGPDGGFGSAGTGGDRHVHSDGSRRHGAYQFKWWLWNGATWTVLRDWSTDNTFAWTPSTPNPNFVVGVGVRSADNTAGQPDGYPGKTGASRAIPVAIN